MALDLNTLFTKTEQLKKAAHTLLALVDGVETMKKNLENINNPKND